MGLRTPHPLVSPSPGPRVRHAELLMPRGLMDGSRSFPASAASAPSSDLSAARTAPLPASPLQPHLSCLTASPDSLWRQFSALQGSRFALT